jgi:putative nucleotidyltransferase with HDIG domain
MVKRDEIVGAIEANVANGNLIKHMLATEAIMRALARRLGEDEEEWGLTGLLHDIDVEVTGGDASAHSKRGAEMALELGASPVMADAILRHNEVHGAPLATTLDRALFSADPLTGLITAGALVLPEKKLANLKVKSVRKRFKERGFAAGANREQIATCSELGIELDEFIEIGVAAMQDVADSLGL